MVLIFFSLQHCDSKSDKYREGNQEKKIKSDNFTRSNREKSNTVILILRYEQGCHQKRIYTREKLMSIRISRLAKFLTLFVIGWDPWSKKRVDYLCCIEGKWVLKTFTVVNKMPRYCGSFIKYLFCHLPYLW